MRKASRKHWIWLDGYVAACRRLCTLCEPKHKALTSVIMLRIIGLTWRSEPCPTPQAIQAMRTALAHGANYWNGGEIYGTDEYNSLHLLHSYFTQYPEDAEKVVINIKGGLHVQERKLDGSAANVRKSVENCNRMLGGLKTLDLWECGRKDPQVDIEETVGALQKCVEEGKLKGISLSEVGAETIRRAAKIAKIDNVEVEFSLYSLDILHNGIAQACAENEITIIAYSPLGRGFLVRRCEVLRDATD